jgi:hypothetical protein
MILQLRIDTNGTESTATIGSDNVITSAQRKLVEDTFAGLGKTLLESLAQKVPASALDAARHIQEFLTPYFTSAVGEEIEWAPPLLNGAPEAEPEPISFGVIESAA